MTNYSAMHHAEAAKRAAEGTDAEAASVGLEHSAKTYALQAATSAAGTHFKLFHHDWFDYELNDMAWLRADTFSWQDGTVYSEAYNHLVDDVDGKTQQTETVGGITISFILADDGHKIAYDETAVSLIYAATGVAWYYILDTTNQRFKLPRENPAREELIQVIRAKGNGMALGLTDGTLKRGLAWSTTLGDTAKADAYGVNVGTSVAGVGYTADKALGITTDPTKSGIISDMTDSTSVYKGKQYLYFYVGQFTQSATEQTAGLNSELFNRKADVDLNNVSANIDYVIESYQNGNDWYRLYKSGWVEQGGVIDNPAEQNYNLIVEMAGTNYYPMVCDRTQSRVSQNAITPVSTTQFYLSTSGTGSTYSKYWEVKGMSA